MTATKDKLVTVESIAALHDYNEKRTKMGYSDTAMESYIDTKVVAGPDGSTLLPNVSIIAKDKANNSLASINITDLSSMGDGSSGYITLNAANTDIYSDELVVKNEDEDYKIRAYVGDSRSEIELRAGVIGVTGDITAFDNLTVLKTFSAMSDILCYGDINSKNINCDYDINCYKIDCEDSVDCDAIRFKNYGGSISGIIGKGETANIIRWYDSHLPTIGGSLKGGVTVGDSEYNTHITGKRVYIETGATTHPYNENIIFPGLSNRAYGTQSLLWSSEIDRPRWMGITTDTNGSNSAQMTVTINLSESVSNQPNGIVLVFSAYNATKNTSETAPTAANVLDQNFHSFFVPKAHILTHSDYDKNGNSFIMQRAGMLHHKILYISDTKITGHESNMNTTATLHGQTVNNRRFVLREVWGV